MFNACIYSPVKVKAKKGRTVLVDEDEYEEEIQDNGNESFEVASEIDEDADDGGMEGTDEDEVRHGAMFKLSVNLCTVLP